MKGLLLLVVFVAGMASAQKLFFKSNRELQEDRAKGQKAPETVRGFGFKEPRHYFTSRLTVKEMASRGPVGVVKCPDGKSACPDGNTCCMMATKSYGCCPLMRADCCQDGKHCCPFGTKCDVLRQACLKGEMEIPWFVKEPAFLLRAAEDQDHEQQEKRKDMEMKSKSVLCKDDEHYCPDGDTCCKMPDGDYACCPMPSAVCCTDGVHCCPQGYTCDLAQSRCVKQGGNHVVDLFVKRPAKSNKTQTIKMAGEVSLEAVKCGSEHECPTGNTCCRLGSGTWGCCPLPSAVCCSDHVHCCPENTQCDVTSGKCNQGNTQIDWFEKQPARQVAMVKCDATHECPSGDTCCTLGSGEWGCCPIPNAVCCSDHVHCCPENTQCDVSSGKCIRGNTQIDWFEKQPARQVVMVKCDATHECPSGDTCCTLGSGEWGCCPIPNAVCCSDHVHCCPENTQCDVSSGKCIRGNTQIDWFEKQPARQVAMVKCDATHECPSGDTCCTLGSGEWGCCPIPNAVCCSDHVHCCPENTQCDVSSGKCIRGNTQIDWFEKQPARQVAMVKCDATHECPSGDTCCTLGSGEWGCCPIPNAVCCSDHVHCCPENTQCDVSSGKCIRGNTQIDWFEKQPARQVAMVKCDATHECPSGDTCCTLGSGEWGCCPIPNAVCCSDHVHCCPENTQCDVSSGKCIRGNTQIDWFEKQPARQVAMVKCDATHECPSGDTCCTLGSGEWGCCPIPNAVCCSDHVHCCPENTQCDVSSGKCIRGNTQIDWFEKQPARQVAMVKCDATHECPSGDTCCTLGSGEWGCCPLLDAVCCSDHVHCCPENTQCDVTSGKCNQGNTQIDWFEKQPARQVAMVKCDATHECPSGNTCCTLGSGEWGCCPIPNAVCCSDHVHCCPENTQCDVSSGKCIRGNTQIDWFEKQPAQQVAMVKCDATHECPSGDTCCKLGSGEWGCCPLLGAVCCSDHVHCCPQNTQCDVTSGKCNQGNTQIDWFEKQPARQVAMVKCDATHECPSGNTCCTLGSGEWGCCPIPNAVCCEDHVHCCPADTQCDVSKGKCNHGNTQIDWFEKQPARQVGMVKCDDSHACPDGNTCCKQQSGQWGCCQMVDAVCCSDGIHCCPTDTKCDLDHNTCVRADVDQHRLMALTLSHSFSSLVHDQTTELVGNVKCDSTHECENGQTCCRQASGQWGCCPIPNAVCCSDHIHCCPESTICDVSEGKCNHGITQLDWFVKQPARQVDNVRCDSNQVCADGQTCCKTDNGEWGCCPLPNAVCCTDHIHCCPESTTCDVSEGKCNHGNRQIDWFEKQPSRAVGSVVCDITTDCPDGYTCCKMTSGGWGCCPLPNAVCCSDGIHCCPSGYTCDTSAGTCTQGNLQQDWLEQRPVIARQRLREVVCKDGSECQDYQTCCEMSSMQGSYGCCPMPNAVCCSDDKHCCPNGYKCDMTKGACEKGIIKLPWIDTHIKNTPTSDSAHKEPSTSEGSSEGVGDVPCPGGTCQDSNLCCNDGKGGAKCCPYPQGVCCDDHEHCCPHGYICDEGPDDCRIPESGKAVSDLLRKLQARQAAP